MAKEMKMKVLHSNHDLKGNHNHIPGLPHTIADAQDAGWTFSLIGNSTGRGRLDLVSIAGCSPCGKTSKEFKVIFGATPFYTAPASVEVNKYQRKPGLSLVEQAKKKSERSARDAEMRRAMKGAGGSKPQPSSGKKGKNKKQNEARA